MRNWPAVRSFRIATSVKLRDQGREYFQAEEQDKLDDMLKVLEIREQQRIKTRELELLQEAEKQAIEDAKEAAKKTSVSAE